MVQTTTTPDNVDAAIRYQVSDTNFRLSVGGEGTEYDPCPPPTTRSR